MIVGGHYDRFHLILILEFQKWRLSVSVPCAKTRAPTVSGAVAGRIKGMGAAVAQPLCLLQILATSFNISKWKKYQKSRMTFFDFLSKNAWFSPKCLICRRNQNQPKQRKRESEESTRPGRETCCKRLQSGSQVGVRALIPRKNK